MILETYDTLMNGSEEIRAAKVWTPYGGQFALLVAADSAAPAWRCTYCDTRAELDLRFALAAGRALTPEQEALYAPIKEESERVKQRIREDIEANVRRWHG